MCKNQLGINIEGIDSNRILGFSCSLLVKQHTKLWNLDIFQVS